MCKWRYMQTNIWSLGERLKISLDLGVICTEITVDDILNKVAPEASYSSNTNLCQKKCKLTWLGICPLVVSGEWPVGSIANIELRVLPRSIRNHLAERSHYFSKSNT